MLKRALGYDYVEETKEIKEINGKKNVVIKQIKRHMAGDTTAQIFWLKNRKPNEWRDKKNIEHTGEVNNPFKELTTEELKELIRSETE